MAGRSLRFQGRNKDVILVSQVIMRIDLNVRWGCPTFALLVTACKVACIYMV